MLVRLLDSEQESQEVDPVDFVERAPENLRGELLRHLRMEADLRIGRGHERWQGAGAGQTVSYESVRHELVPRGAVVEDIDRALQRLRRLQEPFKLLGLGPAEGELPRAEHRRSDDRLVEDESPLLARELGQDGRLSRPPRRLRHKDGKVTCVGRS